MFDFDLKFDRLTGKREISLSLIQDFLKQWNSSVGTESITELSGGYANSNYLIQHKGLKYVLRVSSRPKRQFLTELALLNKLNNLGFTQEVNYFNED